jgi:transcriptional regulator with XRE-family HTH domain
MEDLRRANDALRPAKRDVPFAAEVKRLARARGLTGVDLANKLDVEESTIHRHLRTRARRPHLTTVTRYAHILDVPEAYLRMVAGYWNETDNVSAAEATKTTFASLAVELKDGALEQLWAHFARSPQRAQVATALYQDQLRRAAEQACGIPSKGDARGLLRQELHRIGIDLSPYLRVRADLAYEIALMLWSLLADEDLNAVLTLIERRLIERGADVRSFKRERLEIEKHGLSKFIEREQKRTHLDLLGGESK